MAKKTTKAASKTKTVKKSAPKKASTKKTSIKSLDSYGDDNSPKDIPHNDKLLIRHQRMSRM